MVIAEGELLGESFFSIKISLRDIRIIAQED